KSARQSPGACLFFSERCTLTAERCFTTPSAPQRSSRLMPRTVSPILDVVVIVFLDLSGLTVFNPAYYVHPGTFRASAAGRKPLQTAVVAIGPKRS
ncbi:MAG: hypothetical protein WA476_22340, partial [Acidobacteriaceae bacterium]